MAKQCTTEQTASRQQWIENGLLELMLEKKYEQITVTELCTHLGLSRRSFYRYFRDLEDVLDSLLNHTFQDMAIPSGLPEIREIQRNFEFWYDHRSLLEALSRSRMTDKLFVYTTHFATPDSIVHYLTKDNLDLWREAALFSISGFVALVIAWYSDGFQKTPAQMAQSAYRILYSPILEKPE